MSTPAVCPHCSKLVAGPVPTAGRGIPCPHCGERFTASPSLPVAKRAARSADEHGGSRTWTRPDWEPQLEDHEDRRRDIPDHLGVAVLITIFLFTPVGIVAIVQAARAKRLVRQGAYKEGRRVSASAKWWVNVSAVVGLVTQAVAVILGVVLGMLSSASSPPG